MLSSFYPIVAGRVSDALSRNRSLYQAQVGKIELQRLQDQLSSGVRFTKPSEDPIAALKVIGLQREMEFQDQTIKNLNSASGFLSASESNLANAHNILTEVRGLAIESATTLAGSAERNNWLQQIDAALDQLQTIANSSYQDRHLFTGGVVSNATLSPGPNGSRRTVLFNGNDLDMVSLSGAGSYISHNVTGNRALGLVSSSIQSNKNLRPLPVGDMRVSDLKDGQGIAPGRVQFSNGTDRVSIDLSKAEFVSDILGSVNGNVTIGGRAVQMTLQDGRFEVQYADGLPGILRVEDASLGKTATSLGIATNTPAPTLPIVGSDLSPVMRLTTRLSDLNDGAGFNWGEGIQIEQGGKRFDIDFSGATTVEDVLNAIDKSGAAVSASITSDGKSLQFQSRLSGTDFAVRELNGTLADDLGLRTFNAQTRLANLSHSQGLQLATGNDLSFQRNDGTSFEVDLDGTLNVQDVLDAINNHPDNQAPANRIVAAIAQNGDGITLSSAPLSPPVVPDPGPIAVKSINGSGAAQALGWVQPGETNAAAELVGGELVIAGKDPNPQEVHGVFNSLLRFREAVEKGDLAGIARASNLIDEDLSRINLTRGSVAIDQQRIDNLKFSKEESQLAMKAEESQQMDTDMIAAINELNARQVAYEASLKFLATSHQLSLFNYL